MKTLFLLCYLYVSVQAGLVRRTSDNGNAKKTSGKISALDTCFKKQLKDNAGLQSTFNALSQAAAEFKDSGTTNIEVLITKIFQVNSQIHGLIEPCKPHAYRTKAEYDKYVAKFNVTCLAERAVGKNTGELIQVVSNFVKSFNDRGNTLVHGEFDQFLTGGQPYFLSLEPGKCIIKSNGNNNGQDLDTCFQSNANVQGVQSQISTIKQGVTTYNSIGTTALDGLVKNIIQFHSKVYHVIKPCSNIEPFFVSGKVYDDDMNKFDKDCLVGLAQSKNSNALILIIKQLVTKYTSHGNKLLRGDFLSFVIAYQNHFVALNRMSCIIQQDNGDQDDSD